MTTSTLEANYARWISQSFQPIDVWWTVSINSHRKLKWREKSEKKKNWQFLPSAATQQEREGKKSRTDFFLLLLRSPSSIWMKKENTFLPSNGVSTAFSSHCFWCSSISLRSLCFTFYPEMVASFDVQFIFVFSRSFFFLCQSVYRFVCNFFFCHGLMKPSVAWMQFYSVNAIVFLSSQLLFVFFRLCPSSMIWWDYVDHQFFV